MFRPEKKIPTMRTLYQISRYVEILLDGKQNLVELFAELEPSWITNAAAESQSETDRLLPSLRALINHPTLPEQIAQLFTRYLEQSKSK